jgi:hypothetical protein
MALVFAAGLAVGCGVSRPWALTPRPAARVPEQFVPTEAPRPGAASCLVHLKDPRDETRLDLIRSTETGQDGGLTHLGDYTVTPAGRYGVGAGELLRVDCGTGRALGVVTRGG